MWGHSVPMSGLSFLVYGVVKKCLEQNTHITKKDHRVQQATAHRPASE